MYSTVLNDFLNKTITDLKQGGRYKLEREIMGPQGAGVEVQGKRRLMFASNNYLGLANNSDVKTAAKSALEKYGYGLASVRFICGTQDIHRVLEQRLAAWLGVEDTILYSSTFMANLGFFASLSGEADGQDVIYSDEFNHASIIDALKLIKKDATVKRIYKHAAMTELERMLQEDAVKPYRFRIIATDGVFSMEGSLGLLSELTQLAQKYGALLFVDDAHGVGVLGSSGAGTPEFLGLKGKIDVLSGTFGKALGGALGGYIGGSQTLIDYLRQKSRTYMFSNSLPPMVVGATLAALDILEKNSLLLTTLRENTKYFRSQLQAANFTILAGEHPIVPVMLGEARAAQAMSQRLFESGLYVVGLWYPVVPEGQARLRLQVSAAHSKSDLDEAVNILSGVGKKLGLIG